MSVAGQFIIREQWQARPPRSVSHNITPNRGGCALHYEGPHMGFPWPHEACFSKVRAIQAFHMDSRGWVDIAYNAVVCPHGAIFEGRWIGVRSAAQGTDSGNQNYYAICGLWGVDDPFTDDAKVAYWRCIQEFRKSGAGTDVKPHRYFHSTGCPGDPVAAWITAGLPVPIVVSQVSNTITGAALIPWETAATWAISRGAPADRINAVAPAYWFLCALVGCRPEVAFGQACKETGFFRFGGDVRWEQYNFAGIGATGGVPGASFLDVATGVLAHVDHLMLYAGAPGYPRAGTPDPRHFPSLFGRAQNRIEGLSQTWAIPGVGYGESIINDYLNPMLKSGGVQGDLVTPPNNPTDDLEVGDPMATTVKRGNDGPECAILSGKAFALADQNQKNWLIKSKQIHAGDAEPVHPALFDHLYGPIIPSIKY